MIGNIEYFDKVRNFGYIKSIEGESFFFFHNTNDKNELTKALEMLPKTIDIDSGEIVTIDKVPLFHSGDEVIFDIKHSERRIGELNAINISLTNNSKLFSLFKEITSNIELKGYLKIIDNKSLFVKHITSYIFIPLVVSPWDIKNIYHNKINELVEFELIKDKKSKYYAFLKDRVLKNEYYFAKKFLDEKEKLEGTIIDIYDRKTVKVILENNLIGIFIIPKSEQNIKYEVGQNVYVYVQNISLKSKILSLKLFN